MQSRPLYLFVFYGYCLLIYARSSVLQRRTRIARASRVKGESKGSYIRRAIQLRWWVTVLRYFLLEWNLPSRRNTNISLEAGLLFCCIEPLKLKHRWYITFRLNNCWFLSLISFESSAVLRCNVIYRAFGRYSRIKTRGLEAHFFSLRTWIQSGVSDRTMQK